MWEVGIRQGFFYTLSDEASDVWRATTTPFIDYHFRDGTNEQTIVPFVGGFVGAVWNESDFTGAIGPEAGLKAYMSDSTLR